MPPFILIVEDIESISDNLTELLEALGFFAIAVKNAELALVVVRTSQVDLILSDIRLVGGISGLDFIRQVREEGFIIPVLFLTADVSPATQKEASTLGVVVNKPFPISRLIKTIQEVLNE